MSQEAKRIYLCRLAAYKAEGWEPCRDLEGRVKILMTPTGPQTYVTRPEPGPAN